MNDEVPAFGTAMTLFLKDPISEKPFKQISQAGFNTVELVAGYKTHVLGTPEELQLIRKAAGDHGITILSAHLSFETLLGGRQTEMDYWIQHDMEWVAELGGKHIVVHKSIFADADRLIVKDGKCYPSFTVDRDMAEWPPMRGIIQDRLEKYVGMAEASGVAIALETEYKNSRWLVDFTAPFDPKWCGICFDTGHAQMDEDAVTLAKLLGPRIIATHLHDNNGIDDEHLPPFEGTIDWKGLMRELKQAGYDKPLVFETEKGDLSDLVRAKEKLSALWME